jgi:hypothetical protein
LKDNTNTHKEKEEEIKRSTGLFELSEHFLMEEIEWDI